MNLRIITCLAAILLLLVICSALPVLGHDVASDFTPLADWTAEQPQAKQIPTASDQEIDRLILQLSDKDRTIRVIAAGALGLTRNPRAVDPLITALKDDYVLVREAAARSLAEFRDPKCVQPVMDMIMKTESSISDEAAIRALVEIGKPAAGSLASLMKSAGNERRRKIISIIAAKKDNPGIRPILLAMGDQLSDIAKDNRESNETRLDAIAVLIAVKYPQALDVISGLLHTADDPEGTIQAAAANALARLNNPKAAGILLSLAKYPSPDIRARAITALGYLRDPKSRNTVLAAIKDPDIKVRQAACYAIAEVKGNQGLELLKSALTDNEERVRTAAAGALSKLGDPGAVESLIKFLDSSSSSSINSAIFALGKIGDEKAVAPLADIARKRLDLRLFACRALSQIPNPAAARALVPYLDSGAFTGTDKTPNMVAELLVTMGNSAVEPLIEALKSDNPRIIEGAALAFIKLVDDGSVDPLIAALSHESEYVRAAAALALGTQGNQKAIQPLIPLLNDPVEEVKECAAVALGELGDGRAEHEILHVLDSNIGFFRSTTRLPAIRALGRIRSEKAVGPILSTLKYWDMDGTKHIREVAVDSLIAITGQDFGHAYTRWLAWAIAEGKWYPSPTDHIHKAK